MKALLRISVLAVALAGTAVHAEEPKIDNGTDPTKLSRAFIGTFEHVSLVGGFNSNVLKLNYKAPLFGKSDWSITYKLPVASLDALGNDNYDIGDASVMVSHVFGMTKTGGNVLIGEMVFDTAGRTELGTGKNVFKGTYVRAFFHEDGAIFAPALVHSIDLWGDDNRADVNATTLDLYYVPKMKDPRNLVTFDPSINVDWENDREFLGLAVTYGRVIGKAFGGNAIVTVKPSIFAGGDRPSKWGIEVGYKIIGF